MVECQIDHDDYKNNGLITKIWGGPGWIFNHSITFGYPLNPTSEQKNQYREYFISLGNVLPCKYCRDSYRKFITTGKTALTDDVLKDRNSLTKWFYDIHEQVNNKLEVDYAISYSDMVSKYESFRARCGKPVKTEKGCVVPLDYKAFSFRKLHYKDAPVIKWDIAKRFILLAKKRNMKEECFCFIDLVIELNGDIQKLKKQKCWEQRNVFCCKQIRRMRENSIPSLEEKGKWKGLPTIDELLLILFLSSNLNSTELDNSIKFLDKNLIE
jgi:hypothetical protein